MVVDDIDGYTHLFMHSNLCVCKCHASPTHCLPTGFMIVSALVRLAGVPVDKAIAAFQAMRAPGIYKPDYVGGLFDYFHAPKCVVTIVMICCYDLSACVLVQPRCSAWCWCYFADGGHSSTPAQRTNHVWCHVVT